MDTVIKITIELMIEKPFKSRFKLYRFVKKFKKYKKDIIFTNKDLSDYFTNN